MWMQMPDSEDLRSATLNALDQPTFAGFLRAVGTETGCPAELRGASPVLDCRCRGVHDVRLTSHAVRRRFWLRLIEGWTAEFAQLAEAEGPAMLAHAWRGLAGQRLAREDRPAVRQMAQRLGLVEVAKLMRAAFTGSPEEMAAGDVFGRFLDCCSRALEERQRQGLPMPDLKWRPVGKRAKSPYRGGSLDESGDAEGWDWEKLRAEFEQRLRDLGLPVGPRPAAYDPDPEDAPLTSSRGDLVAAALDPAGVPAAVAAALLAARDAGQTGAGVLAELAGRPCRALSLDGVRLAGRLAIAPGNEAVHASTPGSGPIRDLGSAPRRLMVQI
jgi:hypothetical protein